MPPPSTDSSRATARKGRGRPVSSITSRRHIARRAAVLNGGQDAGDVDGARQRAANRAGRQGPGCRFGVAAHLGAPGAHGCRRAPLGADERAADELHRLRIENRELRKADETLKGRERGFVVELDRDPAKVSSFIEARKALGVAVALTCRSIGTSPSAYRAS